MSSSITSRAPIDSAAWVNNPDHPSLNSTCGCPAPTAILPFSCRFITTDGDAFLALKEGGVSCAAVLLVRLAPPYTASTRVGGGAITNENDFGPIWGPFKVPRQRCGPMGCAFGHRSSSVRRTGTIYGGLDTSHELSFDTCHQRGHQVKLC